MGGRDPGALTVRFGDFEADLASGELRQEGKRVRIQEKPYRLLVALLERPGELVTRSELRQRLWPDDTYGEFEDNLNSAVLKLRHALGDTAKDPRFIETERGRGYRFVAPVEALESEVSPPFGLSPAGDAQPRGLLSRLRSPGAVVALVAILVAVVALAVTARLRRHAPAAPFAERDWILVADFENLTGEEILDRSLQAALETGIRQSRYLNALPDSRIRETLRRMGREPTSRLNEEVAAEIALREGVHLLLVATVSRLGEVYELTARLVDPESRTDLAVESARAADRERIIEALDELVVEVRRRLGESLESIRQERVPLPQATTFSLDALKLYADATAVFTEDRPFAVRTLEEAIALDPEFALAHAKLGAAYYYQNDRPRGDTHFEKALSLLGRLTLRERLWIQAEVDGWRGNSPEAIEGYRLYVREDPDSSRGWFRLGYQHLANRQCDQAEEAFHRVLAINPSSGGSYINLATCQAFSGRHEEAIASYEKAFEVAPEVRTVRALQELGTILVLAGRTTGAEEIYREMLAGGPDFQVIGLRGLAFLELLAGRFEAGSELFRQATLLGERYDLDFGATELRNRVFLARTLRARGRGRELDRELRAISEFLERRYAEPFFLAVAGKLLAREGRGEELPGLLSALAGRVNEGNERDLACHRLLAGEIALLAGELEEAQRSLELAADSVREPLFLESLAHLYALRGETDEAISVYEEILDDRTWFGHESQVPWMWAPYRLGLLHERRGESESAAEYYQTFVDRWAGGDPDLLDLAAARRRLQALRSRPATS